MQIPTASPQHLNIGNWLYITRTEREKMSFKKNDKRTKDLAQKGGRESQRKHPEWIRNLANIRSNKKDYSNQCKRFNKDRTHQIFAGKMSRIWENILAKKLEQEYAKVYLPSQIFDRVCVTKDGKIVFIECKKIKNGKKDKLKPKQIEFMNLCKELGYKDVYVVKWLHTPNIPMTFEELKVLGKHPSITKAEIIDGTRLIEMLIEEEARKDK